MPRPRRFHKRQRKAQPILVATLATDHRVVSVIQMEIAGQLIGARIANVTAVIGTLLGREELDRHRITFESVAQTIVYATMTELPSIKARLPERTPIANSFCKNMASAPSCITVHPDGDSRARVPNLPAWKLNGQPVTAINKFVTEADACRWTATGVRTGCNGRVRSLGGTGLADTDRAFT